jgi:hypothetical protein
MKQLLFLALLILSSGPAYAEWIEVTKSADGITLYYDPSTIRHKGNLVKIWQMYNLGNSETYMNDSYLSLLVQEEYDCPEERVRILAQTAFAGEMRSGKTVFSTSEEGKWKTVAPGSLHKRMWTLVCGNQ